MEEALPLWVVGLQDLQPWAPWRPLQDTHPPAPTLDLITSPRPSRPLRHHPGRLIASSLAQVPLSDPGDQCPLHLRVAPPTCRSRTRATTPKATTSVTSTSSRTTKVQEAQLRLRFQPDPRTSVRFLVGRPPFPRPRVNTPSQE